MVKDIELRTTRTLCHTFESSAIQSLFLQFYVLSLSIIEEDLDISISKLGSKDSGVVENTEHHRETRRCFSLSPHFGRWVRRSSDREWISAVEHDVSRPDLQITHSSDLALSHRGLPKN
jgi:hypothetical protein